MKNIALGRRVLDHVTAHPELDMLTWGETEPCGTVACLAGWAMLLSGYRLDTWDFIRPDGTRVKDESAEASQDAIDRFRAIAEASEKEAAGA